jgi:hypothetical protein
VTGIGSVPWFCGVWWLLLSLPLHGLARLTFWVGDRVTRRVWRLTWVLIRWTNTCLAMTAQCSREAKMEEE